MADTPQLPLTVETAKQNLRAAAGAMSVAGYVKKHPYQSLGAAFLLGMVLADNQRAQRVLLGGQLLNALHLLEK